MTTTRVAFLAIVCLGGILLTFYPTIFSGFAQMQPEAGDVLLNNLFLEHTYRWAFDREYPFSFWSPGYFYPTPYTFTYSETLVGTAPLYWLFRGVGFSETVSCQLWVITTYALDFLAMAVVLRWFGVNILWTAAGAYVFAFGLIRADHLTHQQLMPQYFSPFAVWYAWAFLREPSARRWTLFVASSALQVLASLHLGWFLGLGLLIFVCCGLFVQRGSLTRIWSFARKRPAAMILPVLVAGLIVSQYARKFYQGTPGAREYPNVTPYCPFPDAWFVAAPGSLWADHLTPRPGEAYGEVALFPGFAMYAVFLISFWYAWRNRFPGRGLTLAGVGTALIMCLLITRCANRITLWYFVYEVVPGADAFRAVGRIVFAAYLFGLIGGLTGLQETISERIKRPATRRFVVALIAAIMVVEQVHPFPDHFDKQEQFFGPANSLKPMLEGVDAAYLMYDDSMPNYRHEILMMWAGNWTKVPVINGFSGAAPAGHPGLGVRPTVDQLVQFLGPDWHGKLAAIEWGPPVRRVVYQVDAGTYRRLE